MSLLTELEEFVQQHRQHGTLTGDASTPQWNGYSLEVTCGCGVVFQRWVTPEQALQDMVFSSLLTGDA